MSGAEMMRNQRWRLGILLHVEEGYKDLLFRSARLTLPLSVESTLPITKEAGWPDHRRGRP